MATIKKKAWPQSFALVKKGTKKFEVRVADFKIKKGDALILREWNPKTKKYSGREVKKKVKFAAKFGLDDYGQKKLMEKKGFYVIQF